MIHGRTSSLFGFGDVAVVGLHRRAVENTPTAPTMIHYLNWGVCHALSLREKNEKTLHDATTGPRATASAEKTG